MTVLVEPLTTAMNVCPESLSDQLRGLHLGPDGEAVLALDVPLTVGPLLALVDDSVPHGRPASVLADVVDALVVRLVDETRPDGALDPQQLGSDLPWARILAVLLDTSPGMARQVAVRWVRQLDALSLNHDHVGHPVVVAMAHYALAATELALGQAHRARRHAREADAHVECEGPGVSAAAWARASWLLGRGNGISAPLSARSCRRTPYCPFIRRTDS